MLYKDLGYNSLLPDVPYRDSAVNLILFQKKKKVHSNKETPVQDVRHYLSTINEARKMDHKATATYGSNTVSILLWPLNSSMGVIATISIVKPSRRILQGLS